MIFRSSVHLRKIPAARLCGKIRHGLNKGTGQIWKERELDTAQPQKLSSAQ